jgi:hypothetical protein
VAKDCWTANIFIKVMCVLSVVIRSARFFFGVKTKTGQNDENPKRFGLFFLSKINARVRPAKYRRLRTRTDDREETPQNLA